MDSNHFIFKGLRILSIVANPLFLFFYFYLIIFCFDNQNQIGVTGQDLAINFILCLILPLVYILYHFKKDYFISKKEDRTLPLIITILFYTVHYVYLKMSYKAPFLLSYNLALILGLTAIYFITKSYKISLHASGVSSMCWFYTVLLLELYPLEQVRFILIIIYLIAFGILIERVTSKSHTIGQVINGFLLGLGGSIACYYALTYLVK